MTQRKRDGLSWGHDEKTAAGVTPQHSQQRLKVTAKPGLSWDDDARTVARPADASLPAEAFRPMDQGAAAGVMPAEVPIPLEIRKLAVPPIHELENRPEHQLEPQPAPGPERPPEPAQHVTQRRRRRSALRWVVLTATVLGFYSASYAAVSVSQKLKAHASAPLQAGAARPPLSIWTALGEVCAEAMAKFKGSEARGPAETTPTTASP